MTTKTTTPAPESAADGRTIATLITGRYWDVNGLIFNRDTGVLSHPVDEETEARLREHGHEVVHVEGQEFRKPRFRFSNDAPGIEKRLVPAPSRPSA